VVYRTHPARDRADQHQRRGHLTLQASDGNLVVYFLPGGVPMWSSSVFNDAWLINQGDGNLVLYNSSVVTSPSQALFSTRTQGNGPSALILENNGNLVLVRNSTGRVIWSSNTCCH
jgi:hypothetical protein